MGFISDMLVQPIDNISHLQRICDRVYGIHKLHANYAREFTDWAAVEKDMADGLNSAGHYMDV